MQKKIPLLLATAVLMLGISVVVMFHLYLYSAFKAEHIRKIKTEANKIQKTMKKFSDNPSGVLTAKLIKKIKNSGTIKKFIIWNDESKVLYPKTKLVSAPIKKLSEEYLKRLKISEKNQVLLFEKIPGVLHAFMKAHTEGKNKKKTYYILVHQDVLSEKIYSFLWLMYGAIVILSTLVWFFAHRFSKRIFSVIFALTHSLKHYSESSYTQIIDYEKSDEIGDLVRAYNSFMEDIEKKRMEDQLDLSRDPKAQKMKENTSESQKTSILPKLNHMEICCFPKNITDDSTSLVVFQRQADDQLHCLALDTNANDSQRTACKDRLKDHFIDLVKNGFNPDEIVSQILDSVRKDNYQTLGLSLFYANFNPNTNKALLLQRGQFSIYIQDSSQVVSHLQIDSPNLTNQFTSFEEKDFTSGSYFFLFTADFLKSLGISNFEIDESIFSSIKRDVDSGKNYLTEMLKKLYSESFILTPDQKPAGNVALVYHKK